MEPQPTQSTPQPNEPPPSSSSSDPNPNPNLPPQNPNPSSTNATRPPLTPQQQQQQNSQISQATRPPFNTPWQPPPPPQQQQSAASSSAPPFAQHFGASAASGSSVQRGGVAMGVPAAQSSPFSALNSGSYGQQYGGLGRNAVNMADSVATSSSPMVRPPIQGYQGTGAIGSLGTGALVPMGGVSTTHQPRPIQPSLRPQSTPNNQPNAPQSFPGHSLLRTSSVGSPASPSPNTSQSSTASHNQPWLSSGSQGKPPVPSPSFRPQINQLSQGSHNPQNHLLSVSQQQQKTSSSQQLQPPLSSHQNQIPGKQFVVPFRAPQTLPIQQHITRVQGAGNQKPSTLATQPPSTQTVSQERPANLEPGESCNRILSKRSIHELVNQIDPSENLDPEVEDILVDIADEFVESITTFGCSLAKHRKSSTLEAKDILLHLERNWNMTLPGFSGDEIRTYKKPISNDAHRERLAAIKKSLVGSETTNTKSAVGQGAQKGHMVKAHNAMES